MLTLTKIRREIGNKAYYDRGMEYYEQGCVLEFHSTEEDGCVSFEGVVEGSEEYDVFFEFYEDFDEIGSTDCTCPAFGRSGSCKHVAALMIAVCNEHYGLAGNMRKNMQRTEQRDLMSEIARMMREREEEERRREETEREQFVRYMVTRSGQSRMLSTRREEPVRLVPTLSATYDDKLQIELKIGRKKLYVARNLWDFGERIRKAESFVYGKELIYAHTEAETAPEDVPLLRQIMLESQITDRQPGNAMPLVGMLLDQTMRVLMGRTVSYRMPNDDVLEMQIEEDWGRLDVRLSEEKNGYLLKIDRKNVFIGSDCAVFIQPEIWKIRCVFGEDFRAIEPLLRIEDRYPEGLMLTEEQTNTVCAQVLAPVRERLNLREGARVLLQKLPTPMRPEFLIDRHDEGLVCRVRFNYGAATLAPGENAPGIQKDIFLEEQALRAAEELFPFKCSEEEYLFMGSDEAQFELLTEKIFALQALGEVMIAERLKQMNIQSKRNIVLGVTPEGGELVLRSDLGGYTPEELRAAYLAYRQKRKFVRLASGMFLSGEALEQAAETQRTLEMLDVTADDLAKGARTPIVRAMYLEAALAERDNIELNAPSALMDWAKRLKNAQKTRARQPETLRAELRNYQKEGLTWLSALEGADFGGILADDMGLGKTVQALSLLLLNKEKGETVRALVVCPASLQLNWRSEAEKFAPTLSVRTLMGTAAQREKQLHGEEAELTITSYDQLRRDAQLYRGMHFTHIFLDEAQNIKNASTQGAKAAKGIEADHRFAMTGTPIENRLSELWSIFDFLMPGYLHSYRKFRDRFESPIVKERDEGARRELRLMTAPFILRRMKRDVLTDLPEKVETIMTSELTDEQRRIYAGYAAQLMEESMGGLADGANRMKILAGLTRLRQICCDPALCLENYAGGSGKMEQCVELVRDCLEAGHRILLFSQFTSMLALLEKRLNAEGVKTFVLKGETEKGERMELVERFNAGEADVFLISLKAGGTGLNLTGADVVIHYDPWWNTAAQNQATDRAYRIGQTRGVQVFKLIAGDTLEERILDMQRGKDALADDVLTGEENLFTSDVQVLRQLIRG